jgi:hypothetical protein
LGGFIFGQLIQAAVSRQREFLADASAVQFTRNPDGLSGALQKIGAAHNGSQIENEHAAEASHMFFGNSKKSSLFNAFATHPPLEQRIRAIDPHWDGTFPQPSYAAAEEEFPTKKPAGRSPIPPIIPGFPTGAAGLAGATAVIQANSVMSNLGNPTPQHLRYAVELRESLPENIRAAAHNPQNSCALLYALLLSDDEAQRTAQLQELANRAGSQIHQQVVALWPEVDPHCPTSPPALGESGVAGAAPTARRGVQQFLETLNWLIESDEQIVLFEFVLQKIIATRSNHISPAPAPAPRSITPSNRSLPDCETMLSALAHSGQTDAAGIAHAFQNGAPYVRATGGPLTLRNARRMWPQRNQRLPGSAWACSAADQKESARSLRAGGRRRRRDSGERSRVAAGHCRDLGLPHAPFRHRGIVGMPIGNLPESSRVLFSFRIPGLGFSFPRVTSGRLGGCCAESRRQTLRIMKMMKLAGFSPDALLAATSFRRAPDTNPPPRAPEYQSIIFHRRHQSPGRVATRLTLGPGDVLNISLYEKPETAKTRRADRPGRTHHFLASGRRRGRGPDD